MATTQEITKYLLEPAQHVSLEFAHALKHSGHVWVRCESREHDPYVQHQSIAPWLMREYNCDSVVHIRSGVTEIKTAATCGRCNRTVEFAVQRRHGEDDWHKAYADEVQPCTG